MINMLCSTRYIVRYCLLLPGLFTGKAAFCQGEEYLYSDLKGCTQFYYHAAEVTKKIKKYHDTATYFHDGELVVFYNSGETKKLSPNSFYIFNHGFNKLISMKILMLEIAASNSKKDKRSFVTTPENYFNVLYKDSLASCTHMQVGPLNVSVTGFKKASITAIFVEISYYDQHIFKWFLKEPVSIPEELLPIYWQVRH